MNKKEFISVCSDRKFWQWIRTKSPVIYKAPSNKETFLNSLYKKIENRNYYPSPPQEYITCNKGHGVVRTIPAFQLEDLCIYYYCARKLEKYIALNYVEGTYGGFGLSGKLRQAEEGKLRSIQDKNEIVQIGNESYVFTETSGYPTLSPLNPRAWSVEWGDFTKKLYFSSADFREGIVANLDIGNFYDSIQLDNLEYKLRKYVPKSCNDTVYLLLHFLRFWNRHINFYRQQGAGIPQDVFGECSRILANFYLQAYDRSISKYCSDKGGRFFRYADDQVIFAQNREDLEEMIAKASSLLMREGLNFNQKKVNIMTIRNFNKFYSFKNFLALSGKADSLKIETLEEQVRFYLRNRKQLRKKGVSLLKYILGVFGRTKKRPANFKNLKEHLLSDEFLDGNYFLSDSDLKRIYILLNKREKKKFLKKVDQNMSNCLYSDFLYALRRFYKDKEVGVPTRALNSRISYVRKFYNFKRSTR